MINNASDILGVVAAAYYMGLSRQRLYQLLAKKEILAAPELEKYGTFIRRAECDRWLTKKKEKQESRETKRKIGLTKVAKKQLNLDEDNASTS